MAVTLTAAKVAGSDAVPGSRCWSRPLTVAWCRRYPSWQAHEGCDRCPDAGRDGDPLFCQPGAAPAQLPLQWLRLSLHHWGLRGSRPAGWLREGVIPSAGSARSQRPGSLRAPLWLGSGLPVQVFALARAIYGARSSSFQKLRDGSSRMIHKARPGVCSRIHVDEHRLQLLFCANYRKAQRPGCCNLADESLRFHRARPWAMRPLLGCKLPLVESFDQLAGRAQARWPEFFCGGPKNRRVSTRRLCVSLGYQCAIAASQGQGYRACLAEEAQPVSVTQNDVEASIGRQGGLAADAPKGRPKHRGFRLRLFKACNIGYPQETTTNRLPPSPVRSPVPGPKKH